MQDAPYSGPKLLFRLVVTTGDIVAVGHDFNDMSQHLTPILLYPNGSEEILRRDAKRFIREVRNRIPVEWLCTPDEYEFREINGFSNGQAA